MENLRHFVVGAVAVALMLWPRAGAALSFVIPEPYLNSFHFVVRFIDTSPAGMGVILERVHGPIRVYTVPPAPEVDFEMSDIGPVGYGGIGDPALWDPQMQLLTSGTPYLFEGEIPGFGCLRGKGISGLRYRDQDYPHRVNYNLLPYLMIPVDARQLGRQHFRRPISSSSWMEDEAAMVVVSAFLADSLTTPSYGLSVKALSHEDRDRGYLLEVFDSEDNLLASREVEWFIYESFQFDTVIFSRHVSASIFFGTVNDLEDLQSQSPYSERWLFVPGDIPEGPVTIRRTVPGYLPYSSTLSLENGMEFRIEMPLVPDGGPETGPFIGELPATHPTDGALLAERLLDFCRNDPVGISPDRNRDRVFDAADFLAAAFE